MTAFKVMTWIVDNLFRLRADAADSERQRFQQKLALLTGVTIRLAVNDLPEAQTSMVLCGPLGSEGGTMGFHRLDQGDATRLFNLAPAAGSGRKPAFIRGGESWG